MDNYREGGVKKVLGLPYKKIRIGFIGCGSHASENLYPSLRYAPVELVSVCSRTKEKAERNAKWFGADKAYTDYEEMVAKEALEAVMVSINAKMHHQIALNMLARGLDVFVEKPPALNAKSFLEIEEICQERGRLFFVGFNRRYSSTVTKMRTLIQEAGFGEVIHFDMKFGIGRLKRGVNLLSEVGIHYLDLSFFLFGQPSKITYQSRQIKNGVAYLLNMKFDNGVMGTMTLSSFQSWKGKTERIEITGENRFLIMENANKLTLYQGISNTLGLPIEFLLKQKPAFVWEPNYTVSSMNNNTLVLNGYIGEMRTFANLIKGRKKKGQNLSEIYKVMKVIDKMIAEREGKIEDI
ncbi:MAG: Gfo/Idh/MocA family oxidoreductase [Deltaproteobacteria bacterium]|nr:Gfo/Idh/MocA family oxidoreductase [Deltaproteobacteria bacterium]